MGSKLPKAQRTVGEELIVLVNDRGESIGTAPKLASHHAHTPLHLAFSCYVFDKKGRFLLTRRALSKKVWPGVWTNSVCGHPAPGESMTDAINRRLKYELGIMAGTEPRLILQDYRYRTPPFNGIVENEICPIYALVVDTRPRPHPKEVAGYKWVNRLDLLRDVEANSERYSYWLKDQLKHLVKKFGIQDQIIS